MSFGQKSSLILKFIFLFGLMLHPAQAQLEERDEIAKVISNDELPRLLLNNTLVGTFLGNSGRWAEFMNADGSVVYVSGTENRINGQWGVAPNSNEVCFRFDREPFDFCYFIEGNQQTGKLTLVDSKTAERYFQIDQICKGDVFGLSLTNYTASQTNVQCNLVPMF